MFIRVLIQPCPRTKVSINPGTIHINLAFPRSLRPSFAVAWGAHIVCIIPRSSALVCIRNGHAGPARRGHYSIYRVKFTELTQFSSNPGIPNVSLKTCCTTFLVQQFYALYFYRFFVTSKPKNLLPNKPSSTP